MDESIAQSRHPDSLRRAFLWALHLMLALFLSAPSVGAAQVVTNITSSGLNTTVTQAGNLYNITGGTRPGSGPNLFHSFGDFSVGPGDIGNFLNNTGLPTSNILGRVTGGNISNIYGTIQTTGFGTANLFLVNPSGIVFGPNGSVNVGGSVSFTTAQYLRLFDGVYSANFYANPANDGLANSVLAVAPVVDFGFLSPAAYGFLTPPDPSATITVQGSALSVPSGQSISLVGGNVVIQGATLPDGTVQRAQLSAPNGTIQLASTASPGEFDAATLQPLPNVDGASFTSFGSVSLAPGSNIDVSGPSTVFIIGGQLMLSVNDATLSTAESPSPPDTILLTPGSSIGTANSGTDPGADVQLIASNVLMDGAIIQTFNSGDGVGGNISINASTVDLTNGATFLSSTGQDFTSGAIMGSGNGGNVTIQGLPGAANNAVDAIRLINNAAILTNTVGPGFGGDVHLTARTIVVEGFSTIQTATFGPGRGGEVHVTADILALVNGSLFFTGTQDGNGIGGDLFLNVGTLSLFGGSQIQSGNLNSGTDLDGDGNPDVFGVGGNVTIAADSVMLSGASAVASLTSVSNAGGRISITANSLDLVDEASTITSTTFGAAGGGDIVLSVQQARLLGGATITSRTDFTDPVAAPAGRVTVQGLQEGSKADSLTLVGQGSGIFSSSFGTASPGGIEVHAKTVSLTDGALIQSGDPINTSGTPEGVIIDADSVGISGGSRISSQAFNASAGRVFITADALTLDNGFIVTNTGSVGRGGDVVLNSGIVSLTNGATIDSSTSDTGQAGNITITTQKLALADNAKIRADTLGTGAAGDIALNVDTLTTAGDSIISSSSSYSDSTAGNAGNITIQGITGAGSPATNVSFDNTLISTAIHGGSAANTPAIITITSQALALANGAAVEATTVGAAPAGNIALNVDTLKVSYLPAGLGSSGIFSGSISNDPTAGNAGTITIQGITGAGSPAANVSLDSGDINTVSVGGSGANTPATITITAQTLALANGAAIVASTVGTSPAGNIALNVGTLTVSYLGDFDSGIFSRSLFTDPTAGNAGTITIQGITGAGSSAANVHLDNSTISTTIALAGGTSLSVPANITIAADAVTLSNGGAITASTKGNAPAGNIGLVTQQLTMTPDSAITSNAQVAQVEGVATTGKAGSITITGAGSAPTTITGGTIQAQSETSAVAGDISLQAPGDLTILGTTVSVKNTGTGEAGSINFRAGNDLLVKNSQVSTESAEASGGNIKLTAPNLIHIVDSTINSSVHGQAGSNGGNINIDPQWVVIQNSQLLANANAGAGGNITITATDAVLIDPNSLLSASAGPAGVSGSVNVNAPIQVLSGALMPLNLAYSQAGLSGDRCAADPTGQFSSFVQTGRDGVPQVPGALSPSPLSFLETLTSGSLSSPGPNWTATRLGLGSVRFDDSTRFHSACRS